MTLRQIQPSFTRNEYTYIDGETMSDRDQSSPLQKRELISASIAIGSLVLANLNNMEPTLRALRDIMKLLNPMARSSTRLENGGRIDKDGSIYWKGRLLEFEEGKVFVFVISPEKRQKIVVTGKRVFLNDDPICQNTNLLPEPYYQKCNDKSLWYTSLKVGTVMTPEEVDEFLEIQKQVQLEREKAVNSIISTAEEKLRAAGRIGLKVAGVPGQVTMGAVKGVVAAPRMAFNAAGAVAKGVGQGGKKVVGFTRDSFGRAGPEPGRTGLSIRINSMVWGPKLGEETPSEAPDSLSRANSGASYASSGSDSDGSEASGAKVTAMIQGSASGRLDRLNKWLWGRPPKSRSPPKLKPTASSKSGWGFGAFSRRSSKSG